MDDKLTIVTNNIPRDVLDGSELTDAERAEFDYLDWPAIERGEDSASFFRYKGQVYDLGEFDRWSGPEDSPLAAWHGFVSDTYFSGVLVRYVEDATYGYGESIVVGRFYA
jgi:hypothetical protein